MFQKNWFKHIIETNHNFQKERTGENMSLKVQLHKNGASVSYACVASTMTALELLAKNEPDLIYEVLNKSLVPGYMPNRRLEEKLQSNYHLLDKYGRMSGDEKEVIFNALRVDLTTKKWLTVVNPISGFPLIHVQWNDDRTEYIVY